MVEIVLTTFKEIKLFTRTWRNEVICGKFVLAASSNHQTIRYLDYERSLFPLRDSRAKRARYRTRKSPAA